MKNRTTYITATLMATSLLFLGCETGVKSSQSIPAQQTEASGIVDKHTKMSVPSGIVDQTSIVTSGHTVKRKRIFSNSAQPGYYLQVGFFEQYKPNKTFTSQIERTGLNYIILNKDGNHHALVGPYKSYNQAHAQMHRVKTLLHKSSFVVEVLRP
jgi:cell division protein FtsN